MNLFGLPRWITQSFLGILLVVAASRMFAVAAAVPPQDATTCPAGYAMAGGKCEDINECAISNGGCDIQASCQNTPGSRTCGGCPEKLGGSGYQGCFDVNDCPNGDCTGMDKIAPIIVTSGNVTAVATSAAGAVVTFTASALDGVDGARSVRCTPASGSTFPVGNTTVTCTAADAQGNSRTSRLTVAVRPAQ
jgi:hypothetical protein